MAFLGYPRGHRVFTETGRHPGTRLQAFRILTLEPKRLKTDWPQPENKNTGDGPGSPRDAQAACNFSFSASKFSPFFQSVSAIAAILRANVSRAMAGSMPLASAAW